MLRIQTDDVPSRSALSHAKLINWLAKIRGCDTFQGPGSNEADQALAKCAQALEDSSTRAQMDEARELKPRAT